MPGEGSLHQIREALHLQDVGQATAALQKPTTSQQKPQSRAMAGPCHLVQDDIPGRQCQLERLSPRGTGRLPQPVRGGLPRARRSPESSELAAGALSRLCPRLSLSWFQRIPAGSTVHSGRGIAGQFTGGATAARSSAAASTAWPGAPGTDPRRSGTLWGAGCLLDAHGDPARTSGPGCRASRPPAAPGSRLLLPPGSERRERERRS